MKHYFYSLMLCISIVFLVLGCEKSPEDESPTLKSSSATNDELLFSCLNDPSLDCYEKGKIFLDQDTLSEKIITALLSKSKDFDPFVIELILTSQYTLTPQSLINIINCNNIDKNTIENIVLSKTPVSLNVENLLKEKYSINIDHKYDTYQKIISVCLGGVIYTDTIIDVADCSTTGFIIQKKEFRPFYNTFDCDDSNIQKMLNSNSNAGGWTRGELTLKEHDGVTHIFCKRPPYPKCAKKLSIAEKMALTANDIYLIDLISTEENCYKLGNVLLDQEQLSEAVLIEFNKNICNVDPFVIEVLLLSQDTLTEKVLANLIANTDVDKNVLKNILLTRAPLSNTTRTLVRLFRPEISLVEMSTFDDKEILVSMCDQTLIVADSIFVVDKDGTKTFTTYNKNILPLYSPITESNKQLLVSGGNNPRWVYGELSFVVDTEGSSHYVCTRPPDDVKCVKLAKIKR